MNGGPGSSSMIGLLQENGPCVVNRDSNSTELNPWSWNNNVNMLVSWMTFAERNITDDIASTLTSLTK